MKRIVVYVLSIVIMMGCSEGLDVPNVNDGEEITNENNKIYYTTSNNEKIFPYTTEPKIFGAVIISNEYKDGQGVMTFDDDVKSIGEKAFYECTTLESMIIPQSVISAADDAFEGCESLLAENNIRYAGSYLVNVADNSLHSYEIKSNTKFIGRYAFRNCKNLASIDIADEIVLIGNYAFEGCSSLKAVNIENLSAWCNIKWGFNITSNPLSCAGNLYLNGELVQNLEIPSDVKFFDIAFICCASLKNVKMHDGITEIGSDAFAYCQNLENVTLSNNLVKIGPAAFASCGKLQTITIPSKVNYIGRQAFYGCSELKTVFLNNATPPELYELAFDKCPSLEKIYVPISSVEAYKTGKYSWKKYADKIEGYDFK